MQLHIIERSGFTVIGMEAIFRQDENGFEAIQSHLLDAHGLQPKDGIDLERYDARFDDPFDPASQMELYIPIH